MHLIVRWNKTGSGCASVTLQIRLHYEMKTQIKISRIRTNWNRLHFSWTWMNLNLDFFVNFDLKEINTNTIATHL